MRRLPLAAICAVLLQIGLVSCASNSTALSPPPAVTVAKAQYAFEATYNVAATAYLEAVKSKLLTDDAKARCKTLLGQAYAALLVARQAEAVGDAKTVELQAAAISSLTLQVLQLVKSQ